MAIYGFPNRDSYDRMSKAVRHVTRDYPLAKRESRTPKDFREGPILLALTNGTHAAETEQSVKICDEDWVETGDSKDAMNDSAVELPDETKLYIKRIAKKWRIIWAAVCED